MGERKSERGFIKISKVVGQGKVVGPFGVAEIVPIGLVLSLVLWLSSLIPFVLAVLLGAGVLGVIFLVAGKRPDRFLRRLSGKPKRWRRGFHPSRPLLGKKDSF